eukprot:1399612-Rhodomonas_salina.2
MPPAPFPQLPSHFPPSPPLSLSLFSSLLSSLFSLLSSHFSLLSSLRGPLSPLLSSPFPSPLSSLFPAPLSLSLSQVKYLLPPGGSVPRLAAQPAPAPVGTESRDLTYDRDPNAYERPYSKDYNSFTKAQPQVLHALVPVALSGTGAGTEKPIRYSDAQVGCSEPLAPFYPAQPPVSGSYNSQPAAPPQTDRKHMTVRCPLMIV